MKKKLIDISGEEIVIELNKIFEDSSFSFKAFSNKTFKIKTLVIIANFSSMGSKIVFGCDFENLSLGLLEAYSLYEVWRNGTNDQRELSMSFNELVTKLKKSHLLTEKFRRI